MRQRGVWLANIAAELAIPGFLVVNFIDSSMGQVVDIKQVGRIGELAQSQ